MKIKIMADSTCDLSPELVEKYQVEIVPLHILMGEEDHLDGVDVRPGDLFDYVETSGKMSRTAAANVEEYRKVFRAALEEHDAVIHLNISAEFSACYQNACIAAEELGNVYPVDTRNLSTGIGHMVIDAALMAQQGLPPEQIAETLRADTARLEVSFVINTLKYLHKGGRCSAVAALGANLLQLKPCIEVREGKMGVGKKYRGSLEKCLHAYIDERLDGRDDLDPKRIFITHSVQDPALAAKAVEWVRAKGIFQEVLETHAGCTISNHCGPDCLGILFYRKA